MGGDNTGTKAIFYVICLFQGLASVERQIFDFMGYMWLPILFNFLNIVFVIFCVFGVWQKRTPYVVSYAFWTLVWMAWNVFLVCYYLEAGSLKRTDDLLSFGTGSFSWWLVNGFGCNAEYFHNVSALDTNEDEFRFMPIRPSSVTGCLVDYQHVEVIHAAVNLAFALIGLALACFFIIELHHEAMETNSARNNKSIYSIEYSPQVNDIAAQETELYANTLSEDNRGHMTPRRVKRRSYTRSSARSNKSLHRTRRSSARNSLGSKSLNPVTRLMNQTPTVAAPRGPDSSTSNEDSMQQQLAMEAAQHQYGQINPAYESSRPNSIYSASSSRMPVENSRPASALTSYSNFHGQRKQQPLLNHLHNNHNMNVTNLTQETITNSGPNSLPANHHQHSRNHNTSYDDLPPPPSPIAESPVPPIDLQSSMEAAAQVPVPLQRNVQHQRRNEYVNMPVQSQGDHQNQQHHTNGYQHHTNGYHHNNKYDHNEQNDQTLKAHGHRLVPLADQNGGAPSVRPKLEDPLRSNHQPRSSTNGYSEDDYGFSSGPALPPKNPSNPPPTNDTDKWYLKDSMKPIGSQVHGGNCKCYRCQRKLTAI